TALGFFDVDVVDGAVPIEQQVPVTALERAVGVTHDARAAGGDHDDGFAPLAFLSEPPDVTALDVVRYDEAASAGVVGHTDERRGQRGGALQLAQLGGPHRQLGAGGRRVDAGGGAASWFTHAGSLVHRLQRVEGRFRRPRRGEGAEIAENRRV